MSREKGRGKEREWDDQYVISYEINFENLIIFAFILYVTKHCYKLIGIVHAPNVCAVYREIYVEYTNKSILLF